MRADPLKLMVVTGSRADWGYLSVPVGLMRQDSAFDISIVATGQHLDPRSGGTINIVELEGGTVAARVPMTPRSDSPADITRSMGEGLAGFATAIADVSPHLMLLLGDRYETLAAASAGLIARIPMAHIAGGDISEGAIDDAIRHALTKLSHLHFPTNPQAAARLVQMGEDPARVHNVGSTGLDRLMTVKVIDREAFFVSIGHTPRARNLLVTMHPVTLASDPLADGEALLAALNRLDDSFGFIFTGSNADEGGRKFTARIMAFVESHPGATFHASLGTERYINALAHCDAVVGNSSSGLYEAPSMGLPTVNIGTRQDGRLRASSVIDCKAEPAAIVSAIARAMALDCSGTLNPYGDGQASARIVLVLKQLHDPSTLLHKHFHGGTAR